MIYLVAVNEQTLNRSYIFSIFQEAYLPPVLQSSYRVGEVPEDDHATNLRRRHYGIHDHVIDSDNLRQSDDVIVEVPTVEPNGTGEK